MNHKATSAGHYEAFARGDVGEILAGLTPDAVWTHGSEASHDIPFWGTFKGPQQVGQYFAAMAKEVEFTKFHATTLAAEGDHVVTLVEYEATLRKNAQHVKREAIHVTTYNADGKVTRFRVFDDTAALLALWNKVPAKA